MWLACSHPRLIFFASYPKQNCDMWDVQRLSRFAHWETELVHAETSPLESGLGIGSYQSSGWKRAAGKRKKSALLSSPSFFLLPALLHRSSPEESKAKQSLVSVPGHEGWHLRINFSILFRSSELPCDMYIIISPFTRASLFLVLKKMEDYVWDLQYSRHLVLASHRYTVATSVKQMHMQNYIYKNTMYMYTYSSLYLSICSLAYLSVSSFIYLFIDSKYLHT